MSISSKAETDPLALQIAEGTWGPPAEAKEADIFDWEVRAKQRDMTNMVDTDQEEWRRKKEEERAKQNEDVEARMQRVSLSLVTRLLPRCAVRRWLTPTHVPSSTGTSEYLLFHAQNRGSNVTCLG